MKQHITEEQWNELTDKMQDDLLWKYNLRCEVNRDDINGYYEFVSIGYMIEFLGDNLDSIDNITNGSYVVYKIFNSNKCKGFEKESLCDALWEVVKYKIK